MKKLYIMCGLPGSGKTKWIEENINTEEFTIVSADEIRVNHKDYDPKNPSLIHEECVEIAKNKVFELGSEGKNIVMDGGGINNSYTVGIIKKMKELNYFVTVFFIDTPVDICISRNENREENGERFVPISDIINKSYKLKKQINILTEVSDIFRCVPYFSDKYMFFDMDGTISEYQDLPLDEDGNINFVEYEVFKNALPVKPIIDKIKNLKYNGRELFILSASPNSICNKEKKDWIKRYLPFIDEKNIYFVGNRNFKHVFLKQLLTSLDINVKDCTVVDDDHTILNLYKTIGVKVMHPSKFIIY